MEAAKKIQEPQSTMKSSPPTCSLEILGFLKEKLVVCCNIIRKRVKDIDFKLDKKNGIRADRQTQGKLLYEERSFLMRKAKNISPAYLKFIQKEDWYNKALGKLP